MDVKKIILGADDKPIQQDGEPLSVGRAILIALYRPNLNPEGVSIELAEKVSLLCEKIRKSEGSIETDDSEKEIIKSAVSKCLAAPIAGYVIRGL